ncbi:hypothetical protein K170097C1_57330 [Hungatella effluvii]
MTANGSVSKCNCIIQDDLFISTWADAAQIYGTLMVEAKTEDTAEKVDQE